MNEEDTKRNEVYEVCVVDGETVVMNTTVVAKGPVSAQMKALSQLSGVTESMEIFTRPFCR